MVDIFTRKPFTPKAAPAHDGVAYLDAFVEVEQLEQDQRSLAAAFDAALSRLAAREPEAARAWKIKNLRLQTAEQYAELLRGIGTLTGSGAEDTTALPDEPA